MKQTQPKEQQLDYHVQHARHEYDELVNCLIKSFERWDYNHGTQNETAQTLLKQIEEAEKRNIFNSGTWDGKA